MTGAPPPAERATPADRVLVLCSELPPGPGGIGAHGYALARELQAQGRTVALLGAQHYVSSEVRDRFNQASTVPITTFADAADPIRTARRRAAQIRSAVRSFRPSIVVASGGRVLWLAAAVCHPAGVPYVAVAHGSELGGAAWQRRLTRAALDRAVAIVAVSRFTAGLVEGLGVTGQPIEVIHNGAEGDRFAPDPRRGQEFRDRHGLDRAPVILTVGNVTERKGQHRVVQALPGLLEAVPDVRYVLVGRPTEAEALLRRARDLGVDGRVHVLGQCDADEVVAAHQAADVFAMTSTVTAAGDVEGYGIAVVEAALCAVPAVVSSGSGVEEAVADEVTGLVVEATPALLAGALGRVLTDDDLRRRLGAAAERKARSAGTWVSRARRYGDLLDRAVGDRKPRLLVVSHTEHWRTDDGTIVGFGPTLRELDHLATLTSELVHVAPLHDGAPEGMALAPAAPNIRIVPVAAVGGPRAVDRLLALRAVPRWVQTIWREMDGADAVHVRAPAGISMVALALLAVRRTPRARWVKYAGNWAPSVPDAWTYRLQRWWLRRGLARATVTVNGRWPGQPDWVLTFDNPTLTGGELAAGRAAAGSKPAGPPWHLVFVGRLVASKGAAEAIRTCGELRSRGLDVTLDVLGDGNERDHLEALAAEAGDGAVRIHGWLPRSAVEQHLARAHALLLPSATEGFPKVVAEALAFGCVPVTTGVSSLGQVLGETGGAVVVEAGAAWADVVRELLEGERLTNLAAEGPEAAARFSYDTYLDRVRTMTTRWGRPR